MLAYVRLFDHSYVINFFLFYFYIAFLLAIHRLAGLANLQAELGISKNRGFAMKLGTHNTQRKEYNSSS